MAKKNIVTMNDFEEVKEEWIEVTKITYGNFPNEDEIYIYFNKPIYGKFPQIKEAIEKVLNGDDKCLFDADKINHQIEILKAEEEAFNAGREPNDSHVFDYYYRTFSDYKNQTTKQ